MIEVGDQVPSFELPVSGTGNLKFPTGRAAVLYFYPKDDTPGCTTEAIEFTQLKPEFKKLGIDIFGMSADPVKKHEKLIEKHNLRIPLVSDEEKVGLEAFEVWVQKSMYGKTYMGIERTTFLISAEGTVLEVWKKVRVKGHVDAVLEAAKTHFS